MSELTKRTTDKIKRFDSNYNVPFASSHMARDLSNVLMLISECIQELDEKVDLMAHSVIASGNALEDKLDEARKEGYDEGYNDAYNEAWWRDSHGQR